MHNHEIVWIHFDTQWIFSLISLYEFHSSDCAHIMLSATVPKCNANEVAHEWNSNGMYTFDITFTIHTCTTIIPFFFSLYSFISIAFFYFTSLNSFDIISFQFIAPYTISAQMIAFNICFTLNLEKITTCFPHLKSHSEVLL